MLSLGLWVAVEQGRYSNPDAAKYLYETLIARRNKVGRYWFDRLVPLDKFNLNKTSDNQCDLCFVDLLSEIVKGENNGQLAYQFSLKRNNKMSKTVTAHLQFDVSKKLFVLIGIERED